MATITQTAGKCVSDWLKGFDLNKAYSNKTVQLNQGEDLGTGTVLGMVTATGLWEILDPVAGDGSENAAGILWDDANATGVAATLTSGVGTSQLVFTSNQIGLAGNEISVALVDPAGNSQALAVSESLNAITVSLETDGGGTIVSTADEVKAALDGDATIAALISTTSGGTGVVVADAQTNLTGGVDYASDNDASAITNGIGVLLIESELVWPSGISAVQQAAAVVQLEALGFKFMEGI